MIHYTIIVGCDDENYGDSVSIETQRTILQQFAKEQELHVVGEYIDDGWSGTTFERPNFKRMMADVDAGRVNCIVTKDLSRFGRDHIMVGYYLEYEFPEKQVRYIAVSENEDTKKGLSDFVPFKNLFNEWFAKDTSRKVKTALHAKFAAGERTFAYAPLGYVRHPEIKNAIMVDEETRWIIEKIFDLAYNGAGAAKIARVLVDEHVPTAGWLNYQRYGKFAHIYEGAPEEKSYANERWHNSLLSNERLEFLGDSVRWRRKNGSGHFAAERCFGTGNRWRSPDLSSFLITPLHSSQSLLQLLGKVAAGSCHSLVHTVTESQTVRVAVAFDDRLLYS